MAILLKNSQCGQPGPVFMRIEGRKVDFIYNAAGKLLSPHVITNSMWKYASEIRQFQFIQKGKSDYLMLINTTENKFERAEELIHDLKKFVGEESNIRLTFENDIPVLASGKRRKIVNEYFNKG
jgi:phenylacetate-CoA ligase